MTIALLKSDWYNYGARMYDPALGRFPSLNPLSEKYLSWSVDNYLLNNPILLIDPDVTDTNLPITLDCELANTTNNNESFQNQYDLFNHNKRTLGVLYSLNL